MKKGFTLIELLIVMAIMGILSVIGVGAFRSSQIKGRDAQRKSDVKQIANSLELFYQDHKQYPLANETGQILGCSSVTLDPCDWGVDEFTDTSTVYFKTLPSDPADDLTYIYQTNTARNKYRVFARLENMQDRQCIKAAEGVSQETPNCVNPVTLSCGNSESCNYAVVSTNASALEVFD